MEEPWQTLRAEVKGITLDLWGTILDDAHPPASTIIYSEQRQWFLLEELRHCGYAITAEQVQAAYKQAWNYFDDLWEKQIGFCADDGLREMLKHLHAELSPESYQRVLDFFESYKAPPLPLDGAVSAIQALAQHYPLALISDTAWTPGWRLREILDDYEILNCFRALIFSGETGRTKPHPEMFRRALAGLQLLPQACLHVGDLQKTDVAGAKAMGMYAAWIHRPHYAGKAQADHQPDVIVTGVSECAKHLLEERL